jgi:hypothetical protein
MFKSKYCDGLALLASLRPELESGVLLAVVAANTIRFLRMLTCECMREKAWLAARVTPAIIARKRRPAQVTRSRRCVPRLRLRQSFLRTLLFDTI